MNNVAKVTTNTVWQIGSKAINSISGLIIIGLIQRIYGSEGVGIYTLILGYVGFYFVPVDFGLNAIAVKHLVQKEKKSADIFKNLLGLRLCIAGAVMALGLLIALFLPYDAQTNTGYTSVVKVGIGIVALTIAAQAVLATTNAYFQANHKYNYSFFANLVAAIANTLLIIYLANQKLNLLIVISAYTVAGIIGACTALVLVRKQVKSVSPIFDKKYWKELLKETLPLTISLVLNLIYFRIDGLILPIYRGLIEIGQYNVAYKMFDAILVIPNYFANALYPILLEKRTESINAFTSTIKKSAAILALIAVIGSILTTLLAPFAIKVLLNEDSTQTAQYLRILSSGLLFFFLSSISMWALIVIGKQKLLSYIYGTTMILNLVLNILLIPLYGATASAYITITTEALVLLLSGSLLIYNLQRIKNK